MIYSSTECIEAYQRVFPDDICFRLMPDGQFLVGKINDRRYIQPLHETDETFMDRVRRSEAEGRNLFYEEWKEYKPNPNYIY
ncbi:MAG: hypothetical protein IJ899_20770 [Blautia sp.]|nr:hypothetical protein [Blautia sp.]